MSHPYKSFSDSSSLLPSGLGIPDLEHQEASPVVVLKVPPLSILTMCDPQTPSFSGLLAPVYNSPSCLLHTVDNH